MLRSTKSVIMMTPQLVQRTVSTLSKGNTPSATRQLLREKGIMQNNPAAKLLVRSATTSETGAFLGNPEKPKFGLTGVIGTVTIGLLFGSMISKNIASFLEENELFVPSDDDDDD